jgi:hypothetical protein
MNLPAFFMMVWSNIHRTSSYVVGQHYQLLYYVLASPITDVAPWSVGTSIPLKSLGLKSYEI